MVILFAYLEDYIVAVQKRKIDQTKKNIQYRNSIISNVQD